MTGVQTCALPICFTQSRLDEARLSYEQSEFALYEQQVSSTKPQYSLEGEIEIGALRFLGYTIDGSEPLNPGTKLEVVTYWEVGTLRSSALYHVTPDQP